MKNLEVPSTPKKNPKSYFGELKLLLKFGGISLEENESCAYKIYSVLILFFIHFLFPFLELLEVFKHDFDEAAAAMVYVIATNMAFIKTMVILRYRKELGKLLDRIEQEPFLPNPERGGEMEDELIRECIWFTNTQNRVYWFGVPANIFVNTLNVVMKRLRSNDYNDWAFPFGPFTVLNVTSSPSYEISVFYQLFSMAYVGLNFITTDLIIAGILAHISFQFKFLQNNIRRMLLNAYKEMQKEGNAISADSHGLSGKIDGSTIPWKYLKKSITQTVDYHLKIIELAEEMEANFSILLLIVFLVTLGFLGLAVYHTTLISEGDPRLFTTTLEGLAYTCQVLLVCYWGNEVSAESEQVGRAAYEVNFLGTDLRFQKSLALIIRRSQNPTTLTAGKFTVVSLATFTWIMRTSYSAFTVLRTVKE